VKALRKRARKRGLAGRVLFHRAMAPDRLAPAVARLAFTVAPLTETARNTVQGCCPVKIIESMAAGTPVLASDLRVTRALITHGRDGLLVAPGDRRALALALRRLLAAPSLVRRLGDAARRTVKDRFTREHMRDRLEAALEAPVGR
jgi:glycosyltransferase involved in cell wall biosynthesis